MRIIAARRTPEVIHLRLVRPRPEVGREESEATATPIDDAELDRRLVMLRMKGNRRRSTTREIEEVRVEEEHRGRTPKVR